MVVVGRKWRPAEEEIKIRIRKTTNEKDWFPSTVVGFHRLYLVNIDCRWFPFSTDGVLETRKERKRSDGETTNVCGVVLADQREIKRRGWLY